MMSDKTFGTSPPLIAHHLSKHSQRYERPQPIQLRDKSNFEFHP